MKIKDETGNTFLIVIGTVLLFSIIGLFLISLNTSASKQFSIKEEQVQSRHLAEMGIIHYKTAIEKAVYTQNIEFNPVVDKKTNNIDKEASLKKYYTELCTRTNGVNISPNTTTTGTYKVSRKSLNCNINGETPTKIVLEVKGEGQVNKVTKIIDAKIIITSDDESEDGKGDSYNIRAPSEPSFAIEATVPTLDHISSSHKAVIVTQSKTSKDPFVTDASVKLLNQTSMGGSAKWTFNNHLVILDSLTTSTGKGNNSLLKVGKDFYIGGEFNHLSNHTSSIVGGNFIIEGDMRFGTQSKFTVVEDALFGSDIYIQPNAQINIGQDAYFKFNLNSKNIKSNICVNGSVYLWRNNKWDFYKAADSGYSKFNQKCLNSSVKGELFQWLVNPNVDAKYR